ncbi:multidrug resistance protein, putative [Entamoeba invadens IP1]|uniref:Multidrug resistance protein, putative n=1 Tax=Entamoeba invadens IP1 TaxID=370355 RepID=A0A0A1U998_ENTIV|nr:multidrug resistance protein, putative [Entamoeba invadens IP1]ELP91494.1 multidrug resistance protein, putative [Entamoeba invadens IP1]|eukprot:XP_004258265.1 multidrug resistance protein, putative [Entamoeba invadens IP1]
MYDTNFRSIEIDDRDIKTLPLHKLRKPIGMVGQKPVLFSESILDNIIRGSFDEVSMEKIIEISKMANAHDFIGALPEGDNTLVGDRGSRMSGGQKRRIAIERALIQIPKILL